MHANVPKKQKKGKYPGPTKDSGGRGLDILNQILTSTAKIISRKGDHESGRKGGASRTQYKEDDEDQYSDSEKPSKSGKIATDKPSSDRISPTDKEYDEKAAKKKSSAKSSSDKNYATDKQSSDKKSSSEKKSLKKSAPDKEDDHNESATEDEPSSDKKSTEKSSSHKKSAGKTSSDKRYDDDDDHQGSEDKKSKGKSSSDKQSAGKSPSGKKYDNDDDDETGSISGKKSEKSSSDKKTSSKSTSDRRGHDDDGDSDERPSSNKKSVGKGASDKKSSGKKYDDDDDGDNDDYSASDKTGKKSSGKSTSDKSTSGKSTSDKRHDDDDESSAAQQKSSQKGSDKYSTKASAEKSSTNKSDKTGKEDDMSREKSVKGTSSNTSASSKRKKYYRLLEKIEEERERVLRVIHQRADSHEENISSPSPIASLDSTEVKYEKLLIVERVPKEDAKGGKRDSKTDVRSRTPRLSVVTQEQFEKLVKAVLDLESKFGPIGVPGFPENIRLMEEIRKGASLTDAMAALQLSARLEAAEIALKRMMSLITDLASRAPETADIVSKIETSEAAGPGAKTGAKGTVGTKVGKIERDKSTKDGESETRTLFDEPDTVSQGGAMSIKSGVSKKHGKGPGDSGIPGVSASQTNFSTAPSERQDEDELGDPTKQKDYVTYDELDTAMQELYDDFYKTVNTLTTKSNANSDNAVRIANRIETKIEETLNLGDRMNHLENAVAEYVEQINTLDTGLSSQMTSYQEQLTQMQHDLETGLENMAEALATQGGDTEAVTELNAHFTTLQYDFDRTKHMQKELDEIQQGLSLELQDLWKEIEMLRETKSDRDEVADALRDKAGIGVLNGMVTLYQFDAVRGDFEKRVSNAYDKFNNQEVIWQKAIDDLLREINEKAEITQVEALRDDVSKNIQMLRGRLDSMLNLLGEPRSAALSRRLFRDTECLSCSTPAYMAMEEPNLVPPMPAMPTRPPVVGEEAPSKAKNTGDGDHGICYAGLPIPHARDPRARFCSRYCGGSHTVYNKSPRHQLANININRLVRETPANIGADGKICVLDQTIIKRPCYPCNVPSKPSVVKTPHYEKEYKSFGGMSAVTGDSGLSKPTVLAVEPSVPHTDEVDTQKTAEAIDVTLRLDE